MRVAVKSGFQNQLLLQKNRNYCNHRNFIYKKHSAVLILTYMYRHSVGGWDICPSSLSKIERRKFLVLPRCLHWLRFLVKTLQRLVMCAQQREFDQIGVRPKQKNPRLFSSLNSSNSAWSENSNSPSKSNIAPRFRTSTLWFDNGCIHTNYKTSSDSTDSA